MIQLPQDFTQTMEDLLGEEFDSYLASFESEPLHGLRINTNKISVEDFLKISPFHLTPIPWVENGFFYDEEIDAPSKHPYYYAGLYYLQEPSAMTPASQLKVEPGDRVLDLCAAPGGKSTELGARLKGKGILVANDISYNRAKTLLKNIERSGISNACVTASAPSKLTKYFSSYFSKILVDAPCSGEGMFRKDRKMIRSWEENGPSYYVPIQREILEEAYQMLADGGELLYSTCTFDPRENEENIQWLLDAHSDCYLKEMKPFAGFSKGLKGLDKCIRIWPHKMQGEGHFMALLQKDGEANNWKDKPIRPKKIEPDMTRFCDTFLKQWEESKLLIQGDYLSLLDIPLPSCKDLYILRNGLLLGERRNSKWAPSQALAMSEFIQAYEEKLSFSLEDPRVMKYLKGETLDVSEYYTDKATWVLVLADNFPLGFGQVSSGRLKNKYPKNWRML